MQWPDNSVAGWLNLISFCEKVFLNYKWFKNVDISRGKATMDILKFKRDQYDANNNSSSYPVPKVWLFRVEARVNRSALYAEFSCPTRPSSSRRWKAVSSGRLTGLTTGSKLKMNADPDPMAWKYLLACNFFLIQGRQWHNSSFT